MSDDLINEEDEIEEPIEDGEVEDTDDEPIDSDDAGYTPSSKAAAVAAVETLEDFSIASRQKIRDELEDQIAAFLARGGKIDEVPPNVTADPPKKPSPDYGGRPI
jgi:hypothetical protein